MAGIGQCGPGELRRREGGHRRPHQDLAANWGRYCVNVNAVAFGLIGTRMTQAVGPEGARVEGRPAAARRDPGDPRKAIEAQIPLGRAGTRRSARGRSIFLHPRERLCQRAGPAGNRRAVSHRTDWSRNALIPIMPERNRMPALVSSVSWRRSRPGRVFGSPDFTQGALAQLDRWLSVS